MKFVFLGSLLVTMFLALFLVLSIVSARSWAWLTTRNFAQVISPRISDAGTEGEPKAAAKVLDVVRTIRSSLKLTEDPVLQRQFECAALTPSIARDVYFAGRFGGPALMLLLGLLSPYAKVAIMLGGSAIAYLAPALVLGRMVKAHRTKVRLAIPDAVDLLVICVDAGLGLDQAMVRVGEELEGSHPAIHHEFLQINREQRAGKLRLDAWRAMAERVAQPETDALVNMLMQTERFGTPIARALSSFGDTIRQKRRQKAEELAAKTTIKIIFPLVFFIFPCVFLVLLGPAGLSIYHAMAAAGH